MSDESASFSVVHITFFDKSLLLNLIFLGSSFPSVWYIRLEFCLTLS